MESPSHVPRPGQTSKSPRVLACVLCQQRKVKCDRKFPCAHCVKLQVKCVPVSNARPRRRRFPERELLDRLRRYEDLLRRNKIKFEPLHKEPNARNRQDHQEAEEYQPEVSEVDSSPPTPAGRQSPREPKNIWHAMSHGLRDPSYEDVRETVIKHAWNQSFPNDNPVLFGARKEAMDISSLHPDPVHIFRMWQTYLNNVDPLLKVTHAPSLQPRILETASNVTTVEPALEALMFSIYCTSLISLGSNECLAMFGLPKEELLTKYQFGCQQALLNCGFLRSENRDSLTALYMFLVSMYPGTDPRSLSSMLSIAMRIAQRMGFDDESSIRRCTAFEAEMRRRLWWSLVLFDTRISELAEFRPASLIPTWDCAVPLNVNDSDLRIEMKEPPRQGQATEAIFISVRAQLGDLLRHAPFHLDFTNPALKSLEKDEVDLILMEKRIQEDYLCFCDPENALHFITIWMARGQLSKSNLMRHYSKYSSSAACQTEAHRDAIMFHALRMLESDTKIMTSPLTKGYLWFLQCYFPFPAYIFIFQELQLRPINEQFEKVWEVISANCESRFGDSNIVDTPLFRMFAKLILRTWDALEKAHNHSGVELNQPRIVWKINQKMADIAQNEFNPAMGPPNPSPTTAANEFLTSPGTGLGSDGMMFGMGASASLAGPDPRLFFMSGQPSMADMNHLDWMSTIWGRSWQCRY